MSRVIVDRVSHYYGTRQVLKEVSLSVNSGEAVALMGPSGSGKSTLLSILGGLLAPTSGEVRLEFSTDQSTNARASFSWVLQTTNVLPARSLWDNVQMGAIGRGLSKRAEDLLVEECIADVGLTHVSTARARKLSGGEVQRLSIARALCSEAEFVVADEPTGQLDRSTTGDVLAALLPDSRTYGVILATHDEAVARRCDRIWHVRDGVLHS